MRCTQNSYEETKKFPKYHTPKLLYGHGGIQKQFLVWCLLARWGENFVRHVQKRGGYFFLLGHVRAVLFRPTRAAPGPAPPPTSARRRRTSRRPSPHCGTRRGRGALSTRRSSTRTRPPPSSAPCSRRSRPHHVAYCVCPRHSPLGQLPPPPPGLP